MSTVKQKILLLMVLLAACGVLSINTTYAATPAVTPTPQSSKYYCGESSLRVDTAIDLGCRGQGNPIMDLTFAIIRLLSNGVGLVIIGSIIVAGIQYTTSAGDPQKAAQAMGRIRQTLIALGIFIFSYPLLNYLIPRGFFHG